MKDKLGWLIKGVQFKDGSYLKDWKTIFQSPDWHWQYDTHEMTFSIYEHDGQFWKLYHARYAKPGDQTYTYDFGGVACRMVLVKYLVTSGSPHTSMLMQKGEQEWIRTYEYNPSIHQVLISGECNEKYEKPFESKHILSSS